ncbi:UV damage endonuclease UvsE [Sphingomonas lutea]|uniref:UV damage endonuclease UvsE n=1 Tax=Sphingomonas lutea TaxID=1045317 RepID=A0A7G9SIP4_9SPHN|nr:UV damage endonuclease UvsE [Sphingomonas lutea]QNN67719.1 UV damage endonuclease UvsE [Sphingomonas lutea]
MDAPRIGYCCTFVSPSGDEAEQRARNFRGPTIASIVRLGAAAPEKLEAVIAENLDILDRQIATVAALPALERLFRIQSGFLIGWSHPALAAGWTPTLRGEVERRLARAGAAARAADVRLSMHPAQHAILATTRPEALDNALRDIAEHTEIFAMLGYSGWHPHGACINIHGGAGSVGVDGLRAGLDRVPQAALNLLSIENDETSFGLDDLLRVGERVAILIDFHHHWIHSRGEWLQPGDPRVSALQASWNGVRPLAHISVSRENVIPGHCPDTLPDFPALFDSGHKAGHLRGHSDMMWNRAVNDLMRAHLSWCDIEVEAKAKNLASRQLADHCRAAEVHPA